MCDLTRGITDWEGVVRNFVWSPEQAAEKVPGVSFVWEMDPRSRSEELGAVARSASGRLSSWLLPWELGCAGIPGCVWEGVSRTVGRGRPAGDSKLAPACWVGSALSLKLLRQQQKTRLRFKEPSAPTGPTSEWGVGTGNHGDPPSPLPLGWQCEARMRPRSYMAVGGGAGWVWNWTPLSLPGPCS